MYARTPKKGVFFETCSQNLKKVSLNSVTLCLFCSCLPVFFPQLNKEMEEGKIVLGGCCKSDDDPTWQCADCKIEIYKMKIELNGSVN